MVRQRGPYSRTTCWEIFRSRSSPPANVCRGFRHVVKSIYHGDNTFQPDYTTKILKAIAILEQLCGSAAQSLNKARVEHKSATDLVCGWIQLRFLVRLSQEVLEVVDQSVGHVKGQSSTVLHAPTRDVRLCHCNILNNAEPYMRRPFHGEGRNPILAFLKSYARHVGQHKEVRANLRRAHVQFERLGVAPAKLAPVEDADRRYYTCSRCEKDKYFITAEDGRSFNTFHGW